jgi:hypothetical protein
LKLLRVQGERTPRTQASNWARKLCMVEKEPLGSCTAAKETCQMSCSSK